MNAASDLYGIIVDESHRLVAREIVAPHVTHDHFPRVPGTVDEHTLLGHEPRELPVHPTNKADTAQEKDEQERVEHVNGCHVHASAENPARHHVVDRGTDGHRGDDVEEVADARIPPHTLVQAERNEREKPDRHEPADALEVIWRL